MEGVRSSGYLYTSGEGVEWAVTGRGLGVTDDNSRGPVVVFQW